MGKLSGEWVAKTLKSGNASEWKSSYEMGPDDDYNQGWKLQSEMEIRRLTDATEDDR